MMKRWYALLLPFLFTACSSHSVNDYADSALVFDPVDFFNGKIIAEGFVRDRSGKISRSFTADIDAQWDQNSGVLDEVFYWSDGERQTRVWQFTATDYGFVGTAGDVKGEAPMVYAGNVINMAYQLEIPLANGNTVAVNMDDWLVQTSATTIVNVTDMSKFGLNLGQVVLTMRKVAD